MNIRNFCPTYADDLYDKVLSTFKFSWFVTKGHSYSSYSVFLF